MSRRYRQAVVVGAVGVAAVLWAWGDSGTPAIAVVIGSAAAPLAVLLTVAGRLQVDPPFSAVLGGGSTGVLIGVLGHLIVFGFAYAFFLGFAEAAAQLVEVLRVDPRLISAAGSPWFILLLIQLAVVAPLVEETGKALGASVFRPTDRRTAFLAGVAAGAGFAVVENILYALGGGFLGPSWGAIVTGRMLGAAIHPLASGLVVMGWWEWRQTRDFPLLARRFLAGVGVHGIWNGSIVVVSIVTSVYGGLEGFALASVAYAGALGVVAAAVLWRMTVMVASDTERLVEFDSADGRVVAAWAVLAATFLVPVAMLLLAFPTLTGS